MPESLSFADLADLQYELDQGSTHWDKLMEKDTLQALVSMAVERVSGLAGSSPAAEADSEECADCEGLGIAVFGGKPGPCGICDGHGRLWVDA